MSTFYEIIYTCVLHHIIFFFSPIVIMENCSICCFHYSNTDSSDGRNEIKLCCNHSLCESCYLRLDKENCPYCRTVFKYTNEDNNKRKLLNLEYFKWQPPSQISNYIPPLTINSIPRVPPLNNIDQISNQPFSRIKRNTFRRRRRDLSFDEVLESARRDNWLNSQEALEYAQQVADALGDRAPSPLKKAIEDTVDVGVVSESAPLSEEIHQNIMNELDLWEQSLQPLSPETLEEQLQNISKRWGFIK